MWDPYAEFEKRVLPNGLEIYVAHWPGRAWIKAGFIVHAGAEHDPVGAEGTAHFVEHVVCENAGVSNKTIKGFFERHGGGVDFGSTGCFSTDYEFFAPADTDVVITSVNYFADMLLGAKLKNCIERERSIIQQEISDEFGAQCFINAMLQQRKAVYKNFFLERFIYSFGLPETVRFISQDCLQDFYDQYYVPSNMSLVFVGALSIDEVVNIVKRTAFSQNYSGYQTEIPQSVTSVDILSDTYLKLCLSDHGIYGVNRSVYNSVAKVPNIFSRRTFVILEDMLSDILFEEIRENHALAYDFEASFYDLRYFTEFSIAGSIKKGSEEVVSNMVATVISQLDQYNGLFEKTKNNIVRERSLIDISGSALCREVMNEVSQNRCIMSIQDYIDEVQRVSFEDVLHLSKFLESQYRHEFVQVP